MKNIIAAIVAAFLIGSYLSYSMTDSHWQKKWLARDNSDKQSQIDYQQKVKEKSDRLQADKDKIQNDYQKERQSNIANVAASRRDINSLLATIDKLRKERASKLSNSIAGVEGTRETGLLRSDVLEQSIERSEDLAGYADELRERLGNCNRQYESVTKNKAP